MTPSDWLPEIQEMIKRAEAAGYELRPRGVRPWGWLLFKEGEQILDGAFITDVKAEFAKRGI